MLGEINTNPAQQRRVVLAEHDVRRRHLGRHG